MALSIFRVAIGAAPLPNSLQQAPDYFGQGSAIGCLLGCLAVCVGILWRDRDAGLLIQQGGMWFTGLGLVFYGAAVGHASAWSSQGAYAMGLSFGVAAGCGARIVQFQLYIHKRKAEAK